MQLKGSKKPKETSFRSPEGSQIYLQETVNKRLKISTIKQALHRVATFPDTAGQVCVAGSCFQLWQFPGAAANRMTDTAGIYSHNSGGQSLKSRHG